MTRWDIFQDISEYNCLALKCFANDWLNLCCISGGDRRLWHPWGKRRWSKYNDYCAILVQSTLWSILQYVCQLKHDVILQGPGGPPGPRGPRGDQVQCNIVVFTPSIHEQVYFATFLGPCFNHDCIWYSMFIWNRLIDSQWMMHFRARAEYFFNWDVVWWQGGNEYRHWEQTTSKSVRDIPYSLSFSNMENGSWVCRFPIHALMECEFWIMPNPDANVSI